MLCDSTVISVLVQMMGPYQVLLRLVCEITVSKRLIQIQSHYCRTLWGKVLENNIIFFLLPKYKKKIIQRLYYSQNKSG